MYSGESHISDKLEAYLFSLGRGSLTMADEKLCLQWNDFQDLIKVSFGDLRADTDMILIAVEKYLGVV